MDSSFAIVIFVVFAVLAVLGGIYSYQQRQKRLAELRALAERLGWQFELAETYDYDVQFSQFSDFCHGGSRYAYNTLIGNLKVADQPWPVRMGDYHYETTSRNDKGTTTHHHYFSYFLVKLPYPSPDLRIRREGFFDSIAGAMGFDDINFESAEFSRQFHVKSSDKRFAYNVVCPAMMEFLLADDPPAIEIDGGWCYVSAGGNTWSPDEFQVHLVWVRKFFELWPKHLVAALASH